MNVRVWVTSVWDAVALDVEGGWSVADVKEAALRAATDKTLESNDYIVKFRGAEIFDESQSLSTLAVPDGAPLIVLPRRRQPAI